MKKRTFRAAVLCLTLCLLTGCAGRSPSAPASASTTAPTSAAVPAATTATLPVIDAVEVTRATEPTAPESVPEKQIAILVKNADLWLWKDEFNPVQYAVTDLDGNGQLEIIASVCRGTGLFSASRFFEVNESKGTLETLVFDMDETESQPDLMYDTVEYWADDAEAVTWYRFTDILRNGAAEHYEVQYALCKQGGSILAEPICSMSAIVSDSWGDAEETYYDAEGNTISANDYFNLPAAHFQGCRHGLRGFGWFTPGSGDDLKQLLRESCRTFLENNSIG